MKKSIFIIGMMALAVIVLVFVRAESKEQPGKIAPGRTALLDIDADGQAALQSPASLSSQYIVTPVDQNVGNIRSILSGGDNVITDLYGNIHVAALEGSGLTSEWFYAASIDGGNSFDVQTRIIIVDSTSSHYPALEITASGVCNIAYHEQNSFSGTSAAWMATNPDPLGITSWNVRAVGQHTLSVGTPYIGSSPDGNIVMATFTEFAFSYPFNPFSMVRSTDGGPNFELLPPHPDSNEVTTGGVPIAVGNNGYALCMYYNSDPVSVGLDTTITNYPQGNGGSWAGHTETTDGGQTWTSLANFFGTSITDFPVSTGYVNGAPHTLYWAGGSNWSDFSPVRVVNGRVYVICSMAAIDATNHEMDGFKGVWVGSKPVGLGGIWTWAQASPDPRISNGGQTVENDCSYGQMSFYRPYPEFMAVVYKDWSSTESLVITASHDGGASFNREFPMRIQGDELGLPPSYGIYLSVSPYYDSDYGLSLVFLGEAAGVVFNNTLFWTSIYVGPIDLIVPEPLHNPYRFLLKQNYPNPFNPTTTIEYTLKEKTNVTLKIFNSLGQEVITLVSNEQQEGQTHRVIWNGQDKRGRAVSSGVYFYRLQAGGQSFHRKMTLVR